MLHRTIMARSSTKLAPSLFYNALQARGHTAFFGVPDSLLKDVCAYITAHAPRSNHVITCNEGSALAMAAGHHFATGTVPVVYMQNSGWGNAMNPLLSLTHAEVYRIPALLVVGWRGDPEGKADEPQHVAQGRLMAKCLAAAEVPYRVIEPGPKVEAQFHEALQEASEHFAAKGTPFALLVKRDSFESYKLQGGDNSNAAALHGPRGEEFYGALSKAKLISREAAIEAVLGAVHEQDVIVSTTGMPSREVYECRARNKSGHHRDFLTVGCMGHCSSIAAGIAAAAPAPPYRRNIVALDGDGAALMHLGAWPVLAGMKSTETPLGNYKHIVLNNSAHDSVGGQPSVGWFTDFSGMAKAAGYTHVLPALIAESGDQVRARVQELMSASRADGPSFLEILVKKGNRADLGRPKSSPEHNKEALVAFLREKKPKI